MTSNPRELHRAAAAAAAVIATLAASGAGAQQTAALKLLDFTTSVPTGWATRPPSSAARLAELVLRDSVARDSVELIVYYFGAGQGGDVDANIARWTAQFRSPAGSPVAARVVKLDGALTKFVTTTVELEGSYARAVGMGDPANARPGQALFASIVETTRGNLYVQMFGPAAGVRAQREAYLRLVKDIR